MKTKRKPAVKLGGKQLREIPRGCDDNVRRYVEQFDELNHFMPPVYQWRFADKAAA